MHTFSDTILNFLFSIAKKDKLIEIKKCKQKNTNTTTNAIIEVNSSWFGAKSYSAASGKYFRMKNNHTGKVIIPIKAITLVYTCESIFINKLYTKGRLMKNGKATDNEKQIVS